MRTVAVVLAGGTGQRFGTSAPKQLLPLAGRTLIEHSVTAFEHAPGVDAILVVMSEGHAGQAADVLTGNGYRKLTKIITGGRTRVESTWRAIEEQFNLIERGSPELRLKASQAILGKALATSVRQTPEEVKRARDELRAIAKQERLIEIDGEIVGRRQQRGGASSKIMISTGS